MNPALFVMVEMSNFSKIGTNATTYKHTMNPTGAPKRLVLWKKDGNHPSSAPCSSGFDAAVNVEFNVVQIAPIGPPIIKKTNSGIGRIFFATNVNGWSATMEMGSAFAATRPRDV